MFTAGEGGGGLRIDLNADGFLAHGLYERLQQPVHGQSKCRDENSDGVTAGVGKLLQTAEPTAYNPGEEETSVFPLHAYFMCIVQIMYRCFLKTNYSKERNKHFHFSQLYRTS